MQIEIDAELHQQMQAMSPVSLRDERDCGFFVEWLVLVGISTIRVALEKHPELTLGDLVMTHLRSNRH